MRIEFVGDIITQPLGKLARLLPGTGHDIVHHGIDQTMQVLLAGTQADILISHLLLPYFRDAGDAAASITAMQAYCAGLRAVAASGRTLVIANLLAAPTHRIAGMDHLAAVQLTADLNAMLIDLARQAPLVSIADLPAVVARCGHHRAISSTNALVMRMPYTGQVLPEILAEYARCITERHSARKKVIVLDADNTLWGGVVGEDGIDGLEVGDEYPGKVFASLQRLLLDLRDTGLLLCLVTKNNEADVVEAFDQLSMPLKWQDFTATRANWQPKSENIRALADQLNLGIDSMLFIDDNPFELEEVAAALPGISTLRFDVAQAADPMRWLSSVPGLSIWSMTDEDRQKSSQYQQEADRQKLAESATSVQDYIASLGIVIEAGCNRSAHVKRIAQLTNKTNQFNLTTRRYSETAIIEAMAEGQVFDFRVTDRFGDMGIVGVVIVRNARIEAFLMSCRALGRRIEADIAAYVLSRVIDRPVQATFLPTSKNAMVEQFYDDAGFRLVSADATGRHYAYERAETPALTNTIVESE